MLEFSSTVLPAPSPYLRPVYEVDILLAQLVTSPLLAENPEC